MAVGARQPTPGAGAMTLTRGVGNKLIRAAFWLLIGPGTTDLLSGYRVFSKRFRSTVELRSAGFEIETELASEAVARNLRVVEIPIPYHPRIAGTESKLRAFRDGRRILVTIVVPELAASPASRAPRVAGAVHRACHDGSPGVRRRRRAGADRVMEPALGRHPGAAGREKERW